MGKRFVVTGCGRSGTLFTSRLLTAAGVPCGHESACQVTGFKGFGDYVGDASWFAAAYLLSLPPDVVVIHQVRNPLAVARSWYRIGLFGPTPFYTVSYGDMSPRQILRLMTNPSSTVTRWWYVRDQRRLVQGAVDVFSWKPEAARCLRYWSAWNRLVENSSAGRAVYRFRLEDLNACVWSEIGEFIDADLGAFSKLPAAGGKDDSASSDIGPESGIAGRANLKLRYPPRPFPPVPIPDGVRQQAAEYGYGVELT